MRRFIPLVAALLSLSSATHADESRSEALLYNLAFDDQTDIFLFPNLLGLYPGAYFHLPGSIADAYGGLVLGREASAFGVFVRRPLVPAFDQYRLVVTDAADANLGILTGNPGAVAMGYVPGQVIDLLYGAKTWGLGLSLHGWSETSKQEGNLSGGTEPNSALTVDANLGLRVASHMDLHLDLGYREVKDLGHLVAANVGTRYLGEGAERFVFAGELQARVFIPSSGSTGFAITAPLKAGLRVSPVRTVDVAFLGGVDLQLIQPSTPSDAALKVGLGLPTVEIAVEFTPLRWLQVRSAIKGGYGVQLAGAGDTMPKYEQMVFSSGVGMSYGPFHVDGVIDYALWQHGPYFIGGQASLFSGVTLAYEWGREPAAHAPVLAPAPTPAPPAAAEVPTPTPDAPAAPEALTP